MDSELQENTQKIDLDYYLKSMKTSIEQMISFQMVGNLVRSIKQSSSFAEPSVLPRLAQSQKNCKNFSSSSTVDSDLGMCGIADGTFMRQRDLDFSSPNRSESKNKMQLEHPKDGRKREKAQFPVLEGEEMSIMRSKVAAGDKKLKMVIHILFRFEEESIVKDFMDSAKLKKFRRKSRELLGFVMKSYDTFKMQHADSIGLSILLLSASKVGMIKRDFLTIANKISGKNCNHCDIIKKSKSYGIFKSRKVDEAKSA